MPATAQSSDAPGIILLPGDKFFMRRIPLVPDADPAAQAALALEALSPFPLAQLFHGCVIASDRRHAAVFGSYRRNFTADETAAWADAAAVLPDFALWLAGDGSAGAHLHRDGDRLTLVQRDAESTLPTAIHATTIVEGDLAGARARLPTPDSAPRETEGAVLARATQKSRHSLATAGRTVTLDDAFLQSADVRDKAVLVAHRRAQRRDRILWRAFAGALVALAACALFEVALAGGRAWLRAQQRGLATQAEAVEQVRSAESLAVKLEDMAAQQLKPFEMLAAINARRPSSVEFSRVSTEGLRHLTIRAQTANAGDLPAFETALRSLPGIERVELEDRRAREGLTTFQLDVVFRPGWEKTGGGS